MTVRTTFGGILIASVLLAGNHAIATENNTVDSPSGIPPCDALISAGLADRVLQPTFPNYELHLDSFWSLNTRQRSWCFVQPKTAEEVSLALTTLINVNDGAGDWHVAVRSGGHSLAASNNIEEGVTIDLGKMNNVTYDCETNLAGVGPGGKWMNVYRALLDEQDVAAVGGRDGDVGVGGYLLVGGISYYSSRLGFACDNVASMEVVLANGTIVTASKDENDDLFLALKGGSSNAGIVTRFDLETFPAQNLSYGQQIVSFDHSADFAQGLVDFTNAQGPDDVLVPTWMRDSNLGNKTVALAIKVNTVGDANTTKFSQIEKIPSIDDTGMVSTSLADAAAGSQVASGMRTFWRTLTFSNNIDILNRCVELHEDFVDKLLEFLPADEFLSIMIPQPWPQQFIKASMKKGQNILGLEESKRNSLLWTGGVQLSNKTSEADFARAQALVGEWAAGIEEYARQVDGLDTYVALNYADASQDPLKSYGDVNVEFLRKVAEKYDPTGVFQERIPGGFKISRVV